MVLCALGYSICLWSHYLVNMDFLIRAVYTCYGQYDEEISCYYDEQERLW